MSVSKIRTVLSIAGSDPIGGAGIQADTKTVTRIAEELSVGLEALSVVTAVTAQNCHSVSAVIPMSADIVRAQLMAVLEETTTDAVKIGLVADPQQALLIANVLSELKAAKMDSPLRIVLDPVGFASSGHRLSASGTIGIITERLFPSCTLVTPNIPESEMIIGRPISGQEDIDVAAEEISVRFGVPNVLIKGGHMPDYDSVTDTLYSNPAMLGGRVINASRITRFNHPRIQSSSTHGTGCRLSSAIASYLALGLSVKDAVANGVDHLLKHLEYRIETYTHNNFDYDDKY